ncbi:MAG: sulfatase [Chloroflexi bacterium]|jgi:arylsulfatase A|nr:sulfatase [Chloroflexota bacterium]MBT4073735.1 sulfatase [Chloroflexota bacterium]MBT4514154.1 sulfatase [Chloroflexota bacterium]MBT6680504.1 sulfatase [Chloroflexota bacterium]
MSKPNIILINCDDLGYGDLGVYGSSVNKTPAIDKMASEGMRFTDFYVASPVCSPSRGALLTGCYPPRISFGDFEGNWVLMPGQAVGLNPEETTIAGALKDVGYTTKIIGKWHVGDQKEFLPTEHGFDSYFGLPYSNDMGRQADDPNTTDPERIARLNARPPLPLIRDDEVVQEQPDLRALTERYAAEAVRFIRDNREGPFFLYFAHMYVHLPLYAPENLVNASENGDYGACVAGVDWVTEVLMHELKKQGLDEDTLVIFTSDNGSRMQDQGGSNGDLRGIKGTTWEGGLRVPCIMRWPGKIPAGEVRSDITSSIDFFPTLAGIAGAQVPQDTIIDGTDISSLMFNAGDVEPPRDEFFYYMGNRLEAVRKGKWKLHVSREIRPDQRTGVVTQEQLDEAAGTIPGLFDLESDAGETTNVYDAHPDVVVELSAIAAACRLDIGDEAEGVVGANVRSSGHVDNPETLTHYDPEHPYIYAEYDKHERG